MRSTKSGSDQIIERDALRQKIRNALAKERAGQAFGETGRVLKGAVADLRRETMRQFTRGDQIAGRLSGGVDALIQGLFAAAPDKIEESFCVAAVGGFGRGKLAPYSDVDLLFLYKPEFEDQLRATLDSFLYPLWDSGLKLGYAAHTAQSAAEFAKEDIIARTAYLDGRLVCGSKTVFDDFERAYDKLRRKTKNQFVTAKLEEQAVRQTKSDETRYLVEPDIKEGKGGLRDVQTIRWLHKYVYGASAGEKHISKKVMEPGERRALEKASRFLWSVRAHMHDIRGCADEKLTFDIQPEIASRLGYKDRTDMTAAERLMKHYFVNAVEVGRLTRILCARLEEERAKRLPHLPKLLPRRLLEDEAPGKPNLRIRNGRLDFASAAKARRQPRDLFRLFRAYSKQPKIDFHPAALAIVTDHAPKVVSEVRKDPVIAKLFTGIITDAVDPVRVLRIMTETGLLGKYIPAYGSIVGRIDYGLYRRFTLDEHILRCIGLLTQIRKGELKEQHPITTRIVQRAKNPMLFYLALFLHESIWSVRGKSVAECEKLVARVSKRLGLNDEDAALAGWAAARHLLMVRTAERRNLADIRVISTFAQKVGSKERLDLILALSVCHLRMVGAQSWSEIIRRQLTALYEGAQIWFEHGEAAVEERFETRAMQARAETKAALSDWKNSDKERFLDRLGGSIFRSVGPDIITRFAYLARAADSDGAGSAVAITPRDGALEAIIYADDRPGLLADLAGAIAESAMSVRTVHALTTLDGKAIDIFTIQSPDGLPIDDKDQGARIHAALSSAARQHPDAEPSLRQRFGDRRSIFVVVPVIRIEQEASDEATIIETEGLDRPGLLYQLTAALSKLGLTIVSSHVATYGERAVDAFYVQTAAGKKITDARLLARAEKSLTQVLSAGSKQ